LSCALSLGFEDVGERICEEAESKLEAVLLTIDMQVTLGDVYAARETAAAAVTEFPGNIQLLTRLADISGRFDHECRKRVYAREFIDQQEVQQVKQNDPAAYAGLLEKAGFLSEAGELLKNRCVLEYAAETVLEYLQFLRRRGDVCAILKLLEQVEFKALNQAIGRERDCVLRSLHEFGFDKSGVEPTRSIPELALQALFEKVVASSNDETDWDAKKLFLVVSRPNAGGAQRQLVNLCNWLINDPGSPFEECVLYCINAVSADQDTFFEEQFKSVRILYHEDCLRAYAQSRPPVLQEVSSVSKYFSDSFRNRMETLVAVLAHEKPAMVYCSLDTPSLVGAIASHLAQVPRVVVSFRNLPVMAREPGEVVEESERFVGAAYSMLAKYTTTEFNALSFAARDGYADWCDLDRDNIPVIYNGVDTTVIDQQSAGIVVRNELGIEDSAILVGGVFRIHPQKQPDEWVRMANLVCAQGFNCHFVLLGDGRYGWELEQLEKLKSQTEYADRIHLLGVKKNVGDWLRAFDLFVLTTKMEGLCNAVLEAQAFGCPVIVPAVGGLPEAVQPGVTALLTQPHAEAVASAVIWALERPNWMTRAAERGPQFIKSAFSMDVFVRRTCQLLLGEDVEHAPYVEAMSKTTSYQGSSAGDSLGLSYVLSADSAMYRGVWKGSL
jgi:glycosyltransferase involved in cell wall biosynthesis